MRCRRVRAFLLRRTEPVIINNKRPTHVITIFYVYYVLRRLYVVITLKLFNERVPTVSPGRVFSKCLKTKESSDHVYRGNTAIAVAVRFFRTHVARGPRVSRAVFDCFSVVVRFIFILRLTSRKYSTTCGKFMIFYFVTVVTFTSFACYDIFVFKAPGIRVTPDYGAAPPNSSHYESPGGLSGQCCGPATVDQFYLRVNALKCLKHVTVYRG